MDAHTPALAWAISLLFVLTGWIVFTVGLSRSVRAFYERHIGSPRRERLVVASASFFVCIAVTRAITYTIHESPRELHDVYIRGTHVHHLVWGILILIVVGYLWLVQIGIGAPASSRRASTLTALLYGVGAALTLDEFALWLNLADVYWAPRGRESIDALLVFSSFLLLSASGAPLILAAARALSRSMRRRHGGAG